MKDGSLSQKKKEKTINIVMHDALHFFEKNGYDNTTVEQLCQEAMISQSTFFNYFGTKEKVIGIIMEDGLNDFREFAEKKAAEEMDPFERLRAVLDFQTNVMDKYPNVTSVYLSLALKRDEFRLHELKFIEYIGELVMKAFDEAGRECPYSLDMLKNLIGGYFIIPFFCYPPEEAGARVRNTTDEFIRLILSR